MSNDLISRQEMLDAIEGIALTVRPEDTTAHRYIAQVIKAITDQPKVGEWIPCSERLPENANMVLVSCCTKKGIKNVNRAYYDSGTWHGSGSMSGVTAWQPLPEPWEACSDRAIEIVIGGAK